MTLVACWLFVCCWLLVVTCYLMHCFAINTKKLVASILAMESTRVANCVKVACIAFAFAHQVAPDENLHGNLVFEIGHVLGHEVWRATVAWFCDKHF